MLPQEVIRAKRDGGQLDAADIKAFIDGFAGERVTEGQVAAFAMAVFFRGMATAETVALTEAMRDSGDVLDWSDLDRRVVDKHSTGGVGDNVSLMLAPIVAACGAAVPMISGRGLGHTGGTLDKLESIPGYDVAPDNATFRRTVRDIGCAIIGQTARLAPADARFYGVRDVTATVESIPLITASILSKKLAAGLQGLVLDVKTGSGAFMARPEDARALATSLVGVANGAGLRTTALITRMDEALASAAGNAVEIRNAVRFLTGAQRDPALQEVTLALAAEMLVLAGLAPTPADCHRMATAALEDGRAAERFGKMVAALGGPADFVERAEAHLPQAPLVRDVTAERDGTVASVETRSLGLAVVELGGGRTRPQDAVDHAVGLSELVPIGRHVAKGEPLARIHARDEVAFARAAATIRSAYVLSDTPAREPAPAVIERIG
ncbi:thymidine phosphorylase [Aurantimonas endophytica]|uniref:Thymidine phosphorylase n=1 Tax=Aurantimonas endophytica TaxID=1522175 RepID=A0A7W6MP62_9HYPH|nr:thymidine phosphorylase [Aurantimonas endophytica]MBB4002670.1 thymidine phosphorylase [Aurantimonas endophytica]MCO6403550.1 thymidine phosphorylase [Aurantimonas endophytica]